MSKRLWIGNPTSTEPDRVYNNRGIWMTLEKPDGTLGIPTIDSTGYVWARVYNLTDRPVKDAEVKFWFCGPGSRLLRAQSVRIGGSFVDVGTNPNFEDVLCVTPWTPRFDKAVHGCLMAEVQHWLDPYPEADVFDASTYTQIGQRNISLHKLGDTPWQRSFDVPAAGNEVATSNLSLAILSAPPADFSGLRASLGLPPQVQFEGTPFLEAGLALSATSNPNSNLQLKVPSGTATKVYVSVRKKAAKPNALQLVQVVERINGVVVGGLTYAFLL